ncbi:MAG: hypothetical protein L0228_17145 [Planctomycetes bacterium]|nr:hypothetical protein [Planctomycetota bacterium]
MEEVRVCADDKLVHKVASAVDALVMYLKQQESGVADTFGDVRFEIPDSSRVPSFENLIRQYMPTLSVSTVNGVIKQVAKAKQMSRHQRPWLVGVSGAGRSGLLLGTEGRIPPAARTLRLPRTGRRRAQAGLPR